MQLSHMKSLKFTSFYDLEIKVKALVIIQWNFFGNRSILERAALTQRAFEKKQFFLGNSVDHIQCCLADKCIVCMFGIHCLTCHAYDWPIQYIPMSISYWTLICIKYRDNNTDAILRDSENDTGLATNESASL